MSTAMARDTHVHTHTHANTDCSSQKHRYIQYDKQSGRLFFKDIMDNIQKIYKDECTQGKFSVYSNILSHAHIYRHTHTRMHCSESVALY